MNLLFTRKNRKIRNCKVERVEIVNLPFTFWIFLGNSRNREKLERVEMV